MIYRATVGFISIVLSVVLLAACGESPASTTVSIAIAEGGFEPARVEVTRGKAVTVRLQNSAAQEHQWAIQELPMVVQGKADPMAAHNMAGMDGSQMGENPPQLHLVAPPGQSTELTFTPSKAGEYEFRCILPGHSEKGVLVVR